MLKADYKSVTLCRIRLTLPIAYISHDQIEGFIVIK